MLTKIFGWFRSLFHPEKQTVLDPDSMVEHRLRLAGYEPDFCAAIARLERDLRNLLSKLRMDGVRTPWLRTELTTLREDIIEFLSDRGPLVASIREWPPEKHPLVNKRLQEAVRHGTELKGCAEERLAFLAQEELLRSRLSGLSHEYSTSLPRFYAAGAAATETELNFARSRMALARIHEQLDGFADRLRKHHSALRNLRNDLLGVDGKRICGDEIVNLGKGDDLESTVETLIAVAERQSSTEQVSAAEAMDGIATAHLIYAGVRRPDVAVRGKREGSAERALARWKQLRKAGKK